MHALRGIQRPTWNVSNQPKNGFDRCVIIYTSSASALWHMRQNLFLCIYALRSFNDISHRLGLFEQFEEHLKTVRRA